MIQKKTLGMTLARSLALLVALSVGTAFAQPATRITKEQASELYHADDLNADRNNKAEDEDADDNAESALLRESRSNLDAADLEDNYDFNRLAVDIELYLWNRIGDFLDILHCGIAGDAGVGVEVDLTQYLTLGASYLHYERGVDFPHFIPPLWLVNYYDKTPVLDYNTTSRPYGTLTFGPWRYENYPANEMGDVIFPRNPYDVRVELHAGIIGAYASIQGEEVWDFVTGLIGLDPKDDDDRADEFATREPADQFGRGVCNIAFGVFEVPFNILRVTEQEGDLPGISKGVGLGVWRFLCREVVGVVELVTFPFGWQPIIEPEYVFQKKRGSVWQVNRPAFHKNYNYRH